MGANQNKLEQGRALLAFKLAKKTYDDSSSSDKKELKSYAKKIPMMIQTNGLGNTFAFMATKGKSYSAIAKDIIIWLSNGDCPFQLEQQYQNCDTTRFIEHIINLDSSVYRAYSTEVIAFMTWYRRFVEGFSKQGDDKKDAEQK